MQSTIRRCASKELIPRHQLSQNLRCVNIRNGNTIQYGCINSALVIKRNFTDNRNICSDLPTLEKKVRMLWSSHKAKKGISTDTQKKKYILPMFPYPSGDLHLGHLRVYTISDAIARFWKMKGYDVVHPIGWDAFGLPAENAAIERGIDPAVWTTQNIERMKTQMVAMNGSWDWNREIRTCDPNFYKHTQKIFLLLHERGLAYQAESLVNYDPVDKTVLANEQVDANGCSWRSGAKVEKKRLKQWFLRISAFREELLQDLNHLSKGGMWPERVLTMQKNWLGKSQGARVKFPIFTDDQATQPAIEVFTTRPDTMFGVQYIALAARHPVVQLLSKHDEKLQRFLDAIPELPSDSKAGYLLPNAYALNPLSSESSTPDAAKTPLPIYVAPYVLGDYGDGAVMGVPGHDVRDYAFWKCNNPDVPARYVVTSIDGAVSKSQPFVHSGRLTPNNGSFSGQTSATATKNIVRVLEKKKLGSAAQTWRLRDWLVSRQRYWGTPIPIIHCDDCGPVPVPEDELPVVLPKVDAHWAKGITGNPLEHAHDWVNVPCPKCGSAAKRDTDTMDTFVDSSWYFMRYADNSNKTMPFTPKAAASTLPVDLYIGGIEHAILHLLYARFISKFLSTTSLWPAGSKPEVLGEPFKQLLTQGMVHGKTYSDPSSGRFLRPNEVDISTPSKPIVIASGDTANITFEKMSKSKHNGVDPMSCIAKYSADVTRAHILFQAPVTEVLVWDEEKISGMTRWLNRVFQHVFLNELSFILQGPNMVPLVTQMPYYKKENYTPKAYFLHTSEDFEVMRKERLGSNEDKRKRANEALKNNEENLKLWRTVQQTIVSVTEAYSKTYALNTVVSDLMSLTNLIIEHRKIPANKSGYLDVLMLNWKATEALVQMMAPITPAFSEVCWYYLNWKAKTFTFFGLRKRFRYPPYLLYQEKHSVFSVPFPEPDGTLEMLAASKQACVVQVNGKFKFTIEIPIPPSKLDPKALQAWLVNKISSSSEAKGGKIGKGYLQVDIMEAKTVIVARNGKVVNFVM